MTSYRIVKDPHGWFKSELYDVICGYWTPTLAPMVDTLERAKDWIRHLENPEVVYETTGEVERGERSE